MPPKNDDSQPRSKSLPTSPSIPNEGIFSHHSMQWELKHWFSIRAVANRIRHIHLNKGILAAILVSLAYVGAIGALISGAIIVLDYGTGHKLSEVAVDTAEKLTGNKKDHSGDNGGSDGQQGGDSQSQGGGGSQEKEGMTVVRNQIFKDGSPFLVRGFNLRALMAWPGCDNKTTVEAYKHYGEPLLSAAKHWNANTLRFQVAQPGLTRTDIPPGTDERYLNTVLVPGVKLAAEQGFTIILSMQTEQRACPLAGVGNSQPSQQTLDAWKKVVPAVKKALSTEQFNNVMFELFNEPRGGTDKASWQQWLNGGESPISTEENNGETPVGHQAVADAIRKAGAATNVIIAEGMRLGTRLDGVPMLADPNGKDQVVYAFHGYPYADQGSYEADKQRWEDTFLYLTTKKPVLMTEWHFGSEECGTYKETVAPNFLEQLYAHKLGMTPGPFDGAAGTGLIYSWNWDPTDCSRSNPKERGSGQLVQNYYNFLVGKKSAPW